MERLAKPSGCTATAGSRGLAETWRLPASFQKESFVLYPNPGKSHLLLPLGWRIFQLSLRETGNRKALSEHGLPTPSSCHWGHWIHGEQGMEKEDQWWWDGNLAIIPRQPGKQLSLCCGCCSSQSWSAASFQCCPDVFRACHYFPGPSVASFTTGVPYRLEKEQCSDTLSILQMGGQSQGGLTCP